jgi:hypothetical protein
LTPPQRIPGAFIALSCSKLSTRGEDLFPGTQLLDTKLFGLNLGLLSRVQGGRNKTTNNFEYVSSKTTLLSFDARRLPAGPVRAGSHNDQPADRVD